MSASAKRPAPAGSRAAAGGAGHASRRHQPKHAPRVPFAALLLAIVLGGLALLLALNTAAAANELRRHELASRDENVAARLQQAQNQAAASAAPNALASAAAQLGMVPGGNPAFISIGPDGKARILGSPEAATPIVLPPIVVPASTTNHVPTPSATPAATRTGRRGSTSSRPGTHPSTSSTAPATPTPSTTTIPGGPR